MPSPFPGMDPVLERSDYFEGFHNDLLTYLQEFLQPALPEPYFAKSGRRVWVEYSHRAVVPDVNVLRPAWYEPAPSEGGGTGVAVEARTEPLVIGVETIASDEFRETYLEIYMKRDDEKRLVTAIEVLSTWNKASGHATREQYLRKQRETLASQVHLIEIDLLRRGLHTTAVPRDLLAERAGEFDYHVSLRCHDQPDRFYVYPFRLQDPLPEIAVPLLPGDAVVTLDLQAVFNRCYDAGPWKRELDYSREVPISTLRPEQVEWARDIVEARRPT